MRKFHVRFRSFRDIQDFVALASKQDMKLTVGNRGFQVNATSFMGMFALNYQEPQMVTVQCTEEEFQKLLYIFDRFLVQ